MTILSQEQKTGPPDGYPPFDPHHPELEIMLRGLLHELRNPLSSIVTAATLLQDSMQPDTMLTGEENQMLLDVVKKESLRLNHILTRFAEYIKLPEPQSSVLDLTAAIRGVVGELQRQGLLENDIEIDDRLLEQTYVRADESQIRQVLQNLIANAAEAMPGGGILLLTMPSAESKGEAVVCIGDSGAGFLGESRKRAFQLFFSAKAQHLGLGLPLAKNIIELNGGRIWLDTSEERNSSQPAKSKQIGAHICFSLPLAS